MIFLSFLSLDSLPFFFFFFTVSSLFCYFKLFFQENNTCTQRQNSGGKIHPNNNSMKMTHLDAFLPASYTHVEISYPLSIPPSALLKLHSSICGRMNSDNEEPKVWIPQPSASYAFMNQQRQIFISFWSSFIWLTGGLLFSGVFPLQFF